MSDYIPMDTSHNAERPPVFDGPPDISPDEIVCLDVIGSGSFGKVVRGKCRGKEVAIKILHKPVTFTDSKTRDAFNKEVAIMSKIYHPNIVLFLGACTIPGQSFIVSEYLPHGDLEKLLHDKTVQLSMYTRMKMAKDAALGMNWLHCSHPQFIHRDLKSSNLLVDENGRVKVCDFGLSQIKQQGENLKDLDSAKGTPLWMAPEVMQFKEFNEKCDVYSFGIVLWEIATRQEPFRHHNKFEEFRTAVCKYHERPPIPANLEPALADLIRRCWVPVPAERPSFDTINKELDKILVYVAVKDQWARDFWIQNWPNLGEVSWTTFAKALMKELRIPEFDLSILDHPSEDQVVIGFKCLKALLADKPTVLTERDQTVQLNNFGKVLGYFSDVHTSKNNFIIQIINYLREPWFYGNLQTPESQERLSTKPAGTFLVRFSSVEESWFTVSQIQENRSCKHQRVKHTPGGGYSIIDGEEFETLHALLDAKGYVLPCNAGSKYSAIFQVADTPEHGYVAGT